MNDHTQSSSPWVEVPAEDLRRLTERGRVHGTLTSDEVMMVFKDVDPTPENITRIREHFAAVGISIDESVDELDHDDPLRGVPAAEVAAVAVDDAEASGPPPSSDGGDAVESAEEDEIEPAAPSAPPPAPPRGPPPGSPRGRPASASPPTPLEAARTRFGSTSKRSVGFRC
jgi:hypothetical protein